MDYKEFAEKLEEMVKKELGEDAGIQRTGALKNNGVRKDGLTYFCGAAHISPVVYLQDLYDDYQGGISLEECARQAAGDLKKMQRDGADARMFAETITDWERNRGDVFPVLLKRSTNAELLERLVHRPWLDLEVCYRLCLGNEAGCSAGIRVDHRLLACWGITEDGLHTQAFRNMEGAGYCLAGMCDVLREFMPFVPDMEEGGLPELMILTNRTKLYGAAGILKTELLGEYADRIGKNLFILPSSIHECLVMADDGHTDVWELDTMVREVNATQLLPEDVLSDHAYYFDREKREVKSAV